MKIRRECLGETVVHALVSQLAGHFTRFAKVMGSNPIIGHKLLLKDHNCGDLQSQHAFQVQTYMPSIYSLFNFGSSIKSHHGILFFISA